MNRSIPTVTHPEWLAEGARRFGANLFDWQFRCPLCGRSAAVRDFRSYRSMGANTASATHECLGRYAGRTADGRSGCDYALLFDAPDVFIVLPAGQRVGAFAFADPAPECAGDGSAGYLNHEARACPAPALGQQPEAHGTDGRAPIRKE